MFRPRCVFVFCFTVALVCAGKHADAQRFGFETFAQREGLKSIDVSGLLQDRHGLIWIATQSGVFRYDGYRFEQMPVQSPDGNLLMTGLVEDGRGRIWYSTANALGFFDEDGTSRQVAAPAAGFNFDLANRLSPDPGDPDRIFLVSQHLLYSAEAGKEQEVRLTPIFSSEQIAEHPELDQLNGLLSTKDSGLWLGCGSGICQVQGSAIRVYSQRDGLPAEPWLEFFQDRAAQLWVRSERHLYRYDLHVDRFVNAWEGQQAGSLGVRQPQLCEDAQGRLLVNLNTGLARRESGHWSIFERNRDLPSHEIRSILVDLQGSVWLGLDGYGIARWLGYNQFENWNANHGLPASSVVWNLARDTKGDLWIATEGGLERMRRGSDRIEAQPDQTGAPLLRLQSLALAPDGHVWAGSDNGTVFDYDPNTRKSRGFGPFGGVFHLSLSSDGKLWVCAMNGLFVIDTRHVEASPRQKPLIAGHVFNSARDARGDDWFVADSGLYHRSGNDLIHVSLPQGVRPAFSAELVFAKDETAWLTTAPAALVHLKIEGSSARELERIGQPPLNSGSLILIDIDNRGWLWIGTDNGVDVYNGLQWRHLSTDDGLAWNDTDSNAFYEDRDGSIWIGTSGGLSHLLHPEQIFAAEKLDLNLSRVAIGEVQLNPNVTTTVPWSNRPLNASLSTLNFRRAARTSFRYRVEGINEDWQDTAKHDLRYPPLDPGHYRLAVMAVDAPDGLRSPITFVSFVITPPWWRSNIVHFAEFLLALCAMIGLWRWSVRRHVANERRLEGLVQKRTQELESEKAELLRARAALQIQATHDPLTGLLNHGAILRLLSSEMERCRREGASMGVVLADLDHFKQVNDTYGHLTGDMVLQQYAARIKKAVRGYDEVGRYGGEEILIVLPGLERSSAMERLAALHEAVCREPFESKQGRIQLTCSFGFTWLLAGNDSVESVVERADRAMYFAKNNGRNRIEICEEECDQPVPPYGPRFSAKEGAGPKRLA